MSRPYPTALSSTVRQVLCALAAASILAAASPGGLAAQRVDVTLREGTNVAAALSPDGGTLAVDVLGSIWTLPAEGGEATRLTDALGDDRQPVWSPDGRRIAFQSYRGGNWHIWTLRADGTGLRQLTFGPYDDREPHWSPDGRRIVFSSDRRTGSADDPDPVRVGAAGDYDLWELDLEAGELRRLTTHPASDHSPAWSPDGGEIAYVSERDDRPGVYALRPDGATRLIARVDGDAHAPSWSPDGRRVAYTAIAGGGSSSRLMLDGRALTDAGEDVFPFRAQWISPGSFIYTADGRIKRRRLEDGGADRPAAGDAETIDFAASVSFERPEYERRRRDLASTAPRPVNGIVAPRVSPDGGRVAFAALGDLWLLPIGGEPRRLTDDPFVERDPAWSPDGTRLVYASDRAGSMDLWIRDLETGADRRATTLPRAETRPAWSPDGSRIAFLDDAGGLRVLDVEAGEIRMLHDEDVAPTLYRPGRPTWSADGKTIAITVLEPYSDRFREGTSRILMISPDDGSARMYEASSHLSAGKRGDDGPVWSPDGSKLAFVMQGALWILPVDRRGEPQGPLRRLTAGESVDAPSWTGDSKRIVYLSGDRLREVSLVDGRTRDIPLELEWRRPERDGRVVVHAGRLWDGTGDELRRDIDVVIEGRRIAAVRAHAASVHDAGRVVDASDHTVMPGLIEMHTHQGDTFGEALGRAWLAYGITSVREPASNPYRAVARREAVESGRRAGPRIFTTGYTFDGGRTYYSGALSLRAGPQIERELDRAATLGHDVVKTYVRLPDALQRRVIEGAHRRGLWVTSHELYPAVAFGADGVEHLRGTSRRGYSPKISALNRTYGDVIELLTRTDMTLTPTMAYMGAFWAVAARDDALLGDRRFETLFPASVVEGARRRVEERIEPRLEAYEERLEPLGATVRRVVRGGGRVIAGTDAPITPFALSLHAELEAYVRYARLSPYEALRTATTIAADALGEGDELGSIERGKLADLIVVRGDPLDDIRAARRVETVVRGGSVLELADLLRRPAPATAATQEGTR